MKVAAKRKRSKKSNYKPHSYEESDVQNVTNTSDGLEFNASFKHLIFENKRRKDDSGNPIFHFPIANSEPQETTVWNDEVDMYFPRKHFLTKYQMSHDLLDNIIMKPIPIEKIIPPRLFPIPFIEGMPYEKRKIELLKNIPKKATDENKTTAVQPDKKEEVEEGNEVKELATEMEVNKLVEDSNTVEDKGIDNVSDKNKDTSNKDINDTNNDSKVINVEDKEKIKFESDAVDKSENISEKDEQISKEDINQQSNKIQSSNDSEENLSDYDPDFDGYQTPYPTKTKEEVEFLDKYIESRMNSKQPTDFFFGDTQTMKVQERILAQRVEDLRSSLGQSSDISDKYKYNIHALDELHLSFLSHTAETLEMSDQLVESIEMNIKTEFKQKFIDVEKVKQFSTKVFDSVKVGITSDEYNKKYKKKLIIKDDSNKANVLNNNITTNIIHDNINPDMNITTSHPNINSIQNQNIPMQNIQQELQPQTSSNFQMQLPPQHALGQMQQGPLKSEMAMDTQIPMAQPMGNPATQEQQDQLVPTQNGVQNFEFDNNMLYEPGDFDNDDDEFGSLSNEVFLNM